MHKLTFDLLQDYSGAVYTLTKDGQFIKKYIIRYGYGTEEGQARERLDKEVMARDLKALGLGHLPTTCGYCP